MVVYHLYSTCFSNFLWAINNSKVVLQVTTGHYEIFCPLKICLSKTPLFLIFCFSSVSAAPPVAWFVRVSVTSAESLVTLCSLLYVFVQCTHSAVISLHVLWQQMRRSGCTYNSSVSLLPKWPKGDSKASKRENVAPPLTNEKQRDTWSELCDAICETVSSFYFALVKIRYNCTFMLGLGGKKTCAP